MGNFLVNLLGAKSPTWVKGLGTYIENMSTNCRMLLSAKKGERLGSDIVYNNITSKGVFRLGNSELRVKDLERAGCFTNKKALTVGRDPRCSVKFDDPTVSSHHITITQISQNPPRYFVRDLGSTNGTYALKV